MNLRSQIPWSMLICRAILGPAIALTARLPHPELWLGCMIAAGFLSDVYDGILARRWGTATAALRIADSIADTIFYLGVLTAIIERHLPVLRANLGLLFAVLALEAIRFSFDWAKFRRMASYHSYTAKIWGILLAAATIALLCLDRAYWMVTLALAWGILCDLEGLTVSLVLPQWAHDVKSLPRALQLRREMHANHQTQVR
ncbi:MAG TPA: CDP-alcohol phosphatidyltransferase family protein [Terracidiphilus sp.]|nr:CDP-alcohol phosphatidyltransferase family protein [Terracidiphilus sp.]